MPTYNKLVRDKIPEIIAASGKNFTTETLTQEDYIKELQKKLSEEADEYFEASHVDQALGELADILELIHALAQVHGSTFDQIENIRQEKVENRGGFAEKIFLKEVED
ncbi:nucleoside triphosphate pyrophosphohydrolase [Alkalibacillus silvisoli]|uniref:Nucleoside triphosphate pyrophosphohydrolase n=1 Tax=Alkalibacillus silvisoli TaxID=392823 RepID=A0ABN1A2Z1_9BACI